MPIIQSLQWRYATKKFDASKKLSSKQLDTIKQAFNLTALSYGLQTLKLVIVEDATIRKSLVNFAYGQQQVAEASHLLVICKQTIINDKDVDAYFDNVKRIRNTSEEILSPYRQQLKSTISNMSAAEQASWATKQAYIALGNLMTVCAVEGIDACPMEGFIPEKIDEALGLNKIGLNAVLLLPVGFRHKNDFFATLKKVRKPLQDTIIEI